MRRGHRPPADAKLSPPDAAAPVEWLLQDMAEYHVAHCVLVQSSAFGWDNTYMVECLERYPGRFRAIGLVDPESPANARDLERWIAQGLAGFRFHPLYYDREPRGAWWVDAPEHDDLWAAAAATGAILQFHMLPQHAPGAGPHDRAPSAGAGDRGPHRQTRRDRGRRPTRVSIPVLRLADYPHVYAKIGDYQIASEQAFPWADTWPFVRLLAARFGAARMLWGTGYPRTAPARPAGRRPLRYIEQELPLSPAERQQILWDTPARLFGFAAERGLIAAPGTGTSPAQRGGRTMMRRAVPSIADVRHTKLCYRPDH